MSPRRNGSLADLLDRSTKEVDYWFESMEPWRPPGPRRFYPGRTLRTLHLGAITRFQSGIVLLERPLLAPAASDHVRALIELFAHGAWVTGAGGLEVPMTARARAICVELGMANALIKELELLETTLQIPFSEGYVDDKRLLVAYFRRLHSNHACKCNGHGRNFRDVRSTLKSLNAVESEDRLGPAKMFYGLWITFSRAVHFPRLEHIAATAPGGAARKPATTADRAIMLYNLVIVQSYIAEFAATPFPAARREIAASAFILLQEIERLMQRLEGS